ncbi:membrane-bound lytic murein transglycosylase D [Desulfacinum hydrothermale DSM 13146]|uniref:Membrane-bound lytic murein transglycosylase D n=1 Tax=Desulfacinum hydrothermale DSM 13146 TaxID=1121390 RepID=A0A1W1XKQ5_9BACT|nr:transglycosylase SLT domain-containing protein [Desulfacinum hydrothermale]SMC24546.1 membrane-bound lytic murein transglycosylase D [Desulfacinum hydrothermale DSM 13146]
MASRLQCLREGTAEKAVSIVKISAAICVAFLLALGSGTPWARAAAQESPVLLARVLVGPSPASKENGGFRMAAVPISRDLSSGQPTPLPDDSLLGRRGFHVPDHPLVDRYITYYTGKWKKGFQESLDRAWPYLPLMAEILDVMGVPTELVYVVLVESHFKGKARSWVGACGFWQLMPSTARSLGLRVDAYVDERLDPLRSTQAAAVYLRRFYDKFGSWELALAAYNAGPGAVRRALRRHGTSDFWTLRKKRALPRQTRFYVPKIMAAIRICRDLDRYGFQKPRYMPVWAYTTVWVRRPLSLSRVARWSGIPLRDIKRLNPALKRGRIPPKGYRLRLPPAVLEKFLSAYESYLRRQG